MQFKKARLIWEEYIHPVLPNTSIHPKVSFDNGLTWMSLLNKAVNLRLTGIATGSSIKNTQNGFKQLDLMFGFTPYVVPRIADYELEEDSTNGLEAGTYYFAVTGMLFDTPGLDDSTANNNFYVTGSNIKPFSKLVKIIISTKSKVNLFINYPHFTRGICVYYGKSVDSTVNLELYQITNLTQKLKTSIDTSTNPIQLKNNFPFPKVGTVKIENEYIDYADCTWNSTYWQLTGLTRGARGTTVTSHTNPDESTYLNVHLANYKGGIFGEIPEKIYAKPSVDGNLVQYLNFDTQTLLDITKLTTPTSLGNIEYSAINTNYKHSLRFTGYGVVDADLELPTTGSIYFNIIFTDFNINEETDPYIFGSETGLWMKISRFNSKPYFGYGENILVDYEEYKINSLTRNTLHRIGLSWKEDVDSGKVMFNMYFDGFNLLEKVSEINYTEFEPSAFYIGGLYNSNTFTISNTFNGYLDEWRVYNVYNNYSDFEFIFSNFNKFEDIYTGKITIDNNLYNYNTVTNTSLQSYSPTIDKVFTNISTVTNAEGLDIGVYYDDWAIDKFLTDGIINPLERISYPLDSDLLQVKFDMVGSSDGFESPIIKNISIIISDASI